MDKRAHIGVLFDFYNLLLTKKQQEALRLFYEEDLTLSEIGELMFISRQAVYDLIKRSEVLLEKYESKLGVANKYYENEQKTLEIEKLAVKLEKAPTKELWQEFWHSWQTMKDGD